MNVDFRLLLLPALIVLSTLPVSAAHEPDVYRPVTDLASFLLDGRGVLENPDSITLTRIVPIEANPQSIHDYVEADAKLLNKIDAARLQRLLLAESTYSWPEKVMADGTIRVRARGATPRWHVRLRATRGDNFVVMDFAFFCCITLRLNNGGPRFAYMRFDDDDLLAVFRAVFPNDIELEAKEHVHRRPAVKDDRTRGPVSP